MVSRQAKDLIKRLLTVEPCTRRTATQAINHAWLQGKHEERVKLSFGPQGIGTDVLNALVCFCEVSNELRYSLQKLCYSKVDFEMQEILPIFGLFDRKAIGCIDLEDFTTSLLDLAAEITAP